MLLQRIAQTKNFWINGTQHNIAAINGSSKVNNVSFNILPNQIELLNKEMIPKNPNYQPNSHCQASFKNASFLNYFSFINESW